MGWGIRDCEGGIRKKGKRRRKGKKERNGSTGNESVKH